MFALKNQVGSPESRACGTQQPSWLSPLRRASTPPPQPLGRELSPLHLGCSWSDLQTAPAGAERPPWGLPESLQGPVSLSSVAGGDTGPLEVSGPR